MKRLLLLAALLAFGLPSVAAAQVDRATLTGVVTDKGGAVLPGATVTLTNLETNTVAEQPTTATGSFLFVNLIPGRYQIEASLTGFKKSSQIVPLEVGQRARVDATLEVGAFNEVITVQESSSLLNANDGTLGAVVSHTQVANLPLAIRNWDDLLALVPGVQGDRYTEQGGGTSFGRTGGINVHGARALQNNFLLDGVDNNSISENVQELTSQVSRPSVDAIQEFKVVTSPYSAEYGRSPGAAVSVSTKSGTNAIHGTAYEYYRNDALDANDFFSNRAHSAEAPERSEPVRRQRRRPADRGQGVLLRGLRRHADHPRRHAHHQRADGRPARRDLHHGHQGSDDGPAVPEQHDPDEPHRSVRRLDHRARAAAESARRQQLLPHGQPVGQPGSASSDAATGSPAPPTASSAATSTPTASATSPAPSAASWTARAPRPSGTRRSRPTRSLAAGRA